MKEIFNKKIIEADEVVEVDSVEVGVEEDSAVWTESWELFSIKSDINF